MGLKNLPKLEITKALVLILTLLAFLAAPTGYWCIYSNGSCYATWVHYVYPHAIGPLANFALLFLPIAIVLRFVSDSTFAAWLTFAAWALPLSILMLAIIPANYPASGLDFFPFYREEAAGLIGMVFAAASLLLIIWKWIVSRSNQIP